MSASPGGHATAGAATDPRAADARLRGRTYAIPFERVWTGCTTLAGGRMRRWRIVEADDQTGVLEAVATTRFRQREDDVRIRVGLDENGQTRVDLESFSRSGKVDFGRNVRRIAGFCRRLDALLDATSTQILDPTRMASWTS